MTRWITGQTLLAALALAETRLFQLPMTYPHTTPAQHLCATGDVSQSSACFKIDLSLNRLLAFDGAAPRRNIQNHETTSRPHFSLWVQSSPVLAFLPSSCLIFGKAPPGSSWVEHPPPGTH